MNRRNLFLIVAALAAALAAPAASAQSPSATVRKPEWSRYFKEAGARGSMVVLDTRGDARTTYVYNPARADRRYSPASTFKIAHSLFALDAGLLRDASQVIPWDGEKRAVAAWNQDQTLRLAMRNSTVWVYEGFARQLGQAREARYLRKAGYGNALASGNAPFWVEGDLAISSLEQIAFLQRLHGDHLPFAVDHQHIVKDVMLDDSSPDALLRAKTGWTGKIGWWVGWVERPDGVVYFALNMDTPQRLDDLPKRQVIARRILHELGALPAPG